MRIISSFRDYYDSVQAYGQDPSLIYHRTPKTIKVWDNLPIPYKHIISPYQTYIYMHFVGFCGNIYPMLRISQWIPVSERLDKTKYYSDYYCYSVEDVNNFVNANFDKKQSQAYYGNQSGKYKFSSSGIYTSFKEKEVEKFFDNTINNVDFFAKYGAPIIVCNYKNSGRNPTLYLNCKLNDYEFYRIYDPYRAHQEISMFLSGVLGNSNPPIPHVSDSDLIEAKGFCPKTSFRKPKAQ